MRCHNTKYYATVFRTGCVAFCCFCFASYRSSPIIFSCVLHSLATPGFVNGLHTHAVPRKAVCTLVFLHSNGGGTNYWCHSDISSRGSCREHLPPFVHIGFRATRAASCCEDICTILLAVALQRQSACPLRTVAHTSSRAFSAASCSEDRCIKLDVAALQRQSACPLSTGASS